MIFIRGFDSHRTLQRCIDFLKKNDIEYSDTSTEVTAESLLSNLQLEIDTKNVITCHYRLSDDTFLIYTYEDFYIVPLDTVQEVILT